MDAAPEVVSDLRARAVRAHRARLHIARRSGAEFNRYVLRDEETGQPIENAPIHEEWHALISRHRRLVLWSHIESGKTSSISVGRSLYELGLNHLLRICIVSRTERQAVKVVQAISGYITRSGELREVFPDLIPSIPWTQERITVSRDQTIRDPSVQGIGIGGAVLGSRIDLLILDDILDYANTRIPSQREELYRWYRATLAGRMTRNSRIIAVGTAWHPEDLMHRLAKQSNFVSRRFPVTGPDGKSTWPGRWTPEYIEEKRKELGHIEAMRQLDVVPIDESTSMFKDEYINKGLELGDGIELMLTLNDVRLPEGCFTITGVDLAGKKKRTQGAVTSLFTILIYPDGCRQLLCIESGNWAAPEIAARIVDHHVRYGSVVYVEDNGAQSYILDIVNAEHAIPVLPFNTGANKYHPAFGVQSIASELANGKWIIPNEAKVTDAETAAWLSEMRTYDPTTHTGDRLMACWIAREGARAQAGGPPQVGVRILGEDEEEEAEG